ncbi:GntR family transcriptional regulator [Desulfobacterales bacterium HSG17]|nr:GntR family transcriptional regulator [Desulfobacterales bacterium HSG17]
MAENQEYLAYEKIKIAISKGYIKKGSQLKEVALSKSLKMSRATVKGAFKRLVHEGLAEYRVNKGVFVVDPSIEDINESFQIRAQLEQFATTLAADRLTPEDFKDLHNLIQEEKKVFKARQLDRYYEINNAFHLKIAEKSGNRMLLHYVNELLQKTMIFLILFDPFYKILVKKNLSPEQHLKIVNYLEKGEKSKAALEMKHHLETSAKGIDVNRLLPDDYLTV